MIGSKAIKDLQFLSDRVLRKEQIMYSTYIEKADIIELIKKKRKDMLNKEVTLKQIEIFGDGCRRMSNIEDDRIQIKLGYNTK